MEAVVSSMRENKRAEWDLCSAIKSLRSETMFTVGRGYNLKDNLINLTKSLWLPEIQT